jgi:hypothetical protein
MSKATSKSLWLEGVVVVLLLLLLLLSSAAYLLLLHVIGNQRCAVPDILSEFRLLSFQLWRVYKGTAQLSVLRVKSAGAVGTPHGTKNLYVPLQETSGP